MNDRDRQARGFEKQIKHFEDETRRWRMECKELQQKLNEMEGLKLNVGKEKEQLLIDLKSVHARLENEKNRAEHSQLTSTQKALELDRSRELLTAANR